MAFAYLHRVISTNNRFHEHNQGACQKNKGGRGGSWSVALLMNRDEAMLRDLDIRETAILDRVAVSMAKHMRVSREAITHKRIYDIKLHAQQEEVA